MQKVKTENTNYFKCWPKSVLLLTFKQKLGWISYLHLHQDPGPRPTIDENLVEIKYK